MHNDHRTQPSTGNGVDEFLAYYGLDDTEKYKCHILTPYDAIILESDPEADSEHLSSDSDSPKMESGKEADQNLFTDLTALSVIESLRASNPSAVLAYVTLAGSPGSTHSPRTALKLGASLVITDTEKDCINADYISNKLVLKLPKGPLMGAGYRDGKSQFRVDIRFWSTDPDVPRVSLYPALEAPLSQKSLVRNELGEAYSQALVGSATPLQLLEALEIVDSDEADPHFELPISRSEHQRIPEGEPPATSATWHEGQGGEFPVRSKHLTSARAIAYELEREGVEAPLVGKNFIVTEEFPSPSLFFLTSSHATPYTSIKAAGDKHLSRLLLRSVGVSVAKGRYYSSSSDFDLALEDLSALRRVVVKPVSGTKGKGVTVGVKTSASLRAAWGRAFAAGRGRGVLVEEVFVGTEARFVVVGDQCVAVSLRTPPTLVGDGESTIRDLINAKNTARRQNPHLATRPVVLDSDRVAKLHEQGLTPASVLSPGEEYVVDPKAGFSSGAESVDLTDDVHPSFLEVAARSAGAIPGLEIAGVDIMAKDFKEPAAPGNYIVVEINSQPGIGAHHFPAHGQSRNVAGAIVRHHQQPRKRLNGPLKDLQVPTLPEAIGDFESNALVLAQGFQDLGFVVTWLASDYFHSTKGPLQTNVWRSYTSLTGKASVFATRNPKVTTYLLQRRDIPVPKKQKIFKRDLVASGTKNARLAHSFLKGSSEAYFRVSGRLPIRVDPGNWEEFVSVWQKLWGQAAKGVIVEEHIRGEQLRFLVAQNSVVAVLRHQNGVVEAVSQDVADCYFGVASAAAAAFTGLDLCEVVLNVATPSQPPEGADPEVILVRPGPDLKLYAGSQEELRGIARRIAEMHVSALAELE